MGEHDQSKGCVLVTGGAGYIGSHTTVEVLKAGYEAVVVDNLCNSSMESIERVRQISDINIVFYKVDLLDKPALQEIFRKSIKRVEELTGGKVTCYVVDLLDKPALHEVFEKHQFDFVMHFAGLKAVGESCNKPLAYYKNNIEGSITLMEVMEEFGVRNIVFSSSATVYGIPQYLPVDEKHPAGACTNPYGRTKYFIEEILADQVMANPKWNVVLLRYFNPAGAHESGRIGEDPQGPPNNLMPYVAQVAVGRRPELSVFGVRDYIHVVDLALGHVAALRKLKESCGLKIYNLGTGTGYSVLEMVRAFEKASGKKLPYKIVGRRRGDVDSLYADPTLAAEELGWKAVKGLEEMCEDLWRWQSMNPKGFRPADAES